MRQVMTEKVSQRRYKTEVGFRREIERRLRAPVPDDIWRETGGYVWGDADIERGFAVEDDIDFTLRQLRYRRRTGEMPLPAQQRLKEPRDAQLWQLRSRLLALRAKADAEEWRARFLPSVLEVEALTLVGVNRSIVKEGRDRALGPDEFWTWLRLLIDEKEGYFVAEPLAPDGPLTRVESSASVILNFPSSTPPRFLEPDRLPTNWWSGSDSESERGIRVLAIPTAGSARALHPNLWGSKTFEALVREAKWLGGGNWSLAETVGFFLFGAIPMLTPMRANVTGKFDSTGWGARVTLSLDPRVSPEEVEEFYRQLRRDRELRLRPRARAKGFSPGVSTLLEFVLGRWQSGGKPGWSELWREWQEAHGQSKDWSYASPAVMARVVNRALAALGNEMWPAR